MLVKQSSSGQILVKQLSPTRRVRGWGGLLQIPVSLPSPLPSGVWEVFGGGASSIPGWGGSRCAVLASTLSVPGKCQWFLVDALYLTSTDFFLSVAVTAVTDAVTAVTVAVTELKRTCG